MDTDPASYLQIMKHAFEKHYLEGSDVWTEDEHLRSLPALIQARLRLPPTAHVLDIGCGPGRDSEYFASLIASVVGLDLCVHEDWKRAATRHPNLTFRRVDFLSFDSPELYDLILDNGCFHHQHPHQYTKYLNKVRSLMHGRSGFVLSTYRNHQISEQVDSNGRLFKYFSDAALHEELSHGGLTVGYETTAHRSTQKGEYRLTFCHLTVR